MSAEEDVARVLEHCVARALAEAGFKAAEARALAFFALAARNYLAYVATALQRHAQYAHRPAPTLVDGAQTMAGMGLALAPGDLKRNSARPPLLRLAREERPPLPDGPPESELCVPTEAPSNYHEFLPRFPPAHTFRATQAKRRIVDDKARKAKARHEQALAASASLLRILEKTGGAPRRANYLLERN